MEQEDELARYLAEGWEIKAYSVCMMAAGATSHYVLLQKDLSVAICTLVNPGPVEIGRAVNVISPKPPAPEKKKGFFG